MASIALLTGGHLCNNPRAHKEALALSEAGHEVEVLGGWLEPGLKARDESLCAGAPFKFRAVFDRTALSGPRRLAYLSSRLLGRCAAAVYRLGGPGSAAQLGPAVGPLARAAGVSRADLVIAHSEAGLIAARALLSQRRKVALDLEDWFSEDLPPEQRGSRPVELLRRAEAEVLRQGAYSSCPSRAMSAAVAKAYGCPPPAVVYNVFAWSDRRAIDGQARAKRRATPTIHWFSQTLGPGRGLEDLLQALARLPCDTEIHLRGHRQPGFERWLARWTPPAWSSRVFVHEVVDNSELLACIAEHDIGFAGEMKLARSRDLTVTNKLLHYLLGGLAVVASDTDGQREIAAAAPEAVSLYPAGDAAALGRILEGLLSDPGRLRRAKAAALRAAQERFCWEKQKHVLVSAVEAALRSNR